MTRYYCDRCDQELGSSANYTDMDSSSVSLRRYEEGKVVVPESPSQVLCRRCYTDILHYVLTIPAWSR